MVRHRQPSPIPQLVRHISSRVNKAQKSAEYNSATDRVPKHWAPSTADWPRALQKENNPLGRHTQTFPAKRSRKKLPFSTVNTRVWLGARTLVARTHTFKDQPPGAIVTALGALIVDAAVVAVDGGGGVEKWKHSRECFRVRECSRRAWPLARVECSSQAPISSRQWSGSAENPGRLRASSGRWIRDE